MVFNPNVGRQSFTASGEQTEFDFNFKIYIDSDIKVYLTPVGESPDDVVNLLTLSNDYTVVTDGDDGGAITLTVGATNGDTLVLVRDLPKTRYINYVQNGDLLAATLNGDQDYQTYLIRDGFRSSERALTLPTTDTTMNTELPPTQPGKVLGVNHNGTHFEYLDTVFTIDEGVTVSNITSMLLVNGVVNSKVTVLGYYAKGDGGGGLFYWDPLSTADDDGGYTFGTAPIGRWKRVPKGSVRSKEFGTKGDGVIDDTDTIKALFGYVNKNADFNNLFKTFTKDDSDRGIGEIPKVEFDAEDVHLISDTIVVSTNVEIEFNGAALIAHSSMAGVDALSSKDMIEIRYKYPDDPPESYSNLFNSIRNLKLDGRRYARNGILLDRTNWSRYDNIYITGCQNYGMKLEECQYSLFTQVYCENNENGIHLGNTQENVSLRCIDLTFMGCTFHRSKNIGLHISNASHCKFYSLDIGRNDYTCILFDNDNGDGGAASSSISRSNTFNGAKVEYNADDQPTSGYAVMQLAGAYANTYVDFIFAHQPGTIDTNTAWYRWFHIGGERNSIINPQISSSAVTIPTNPSTPTDVARFKSESSNGLTVAFTGWVPSYDDLIAIAVDGADAIIQPNNSKCVVNTFGSTQISTASQPKFVAGTNRRGLSQYAEARDEAIVAMIRESTNRGGLALGDGLIDILSAPRLQSVSEKVVEMRYGSLRMPNDAVDDETLQIGNYRLWVDPSGKLRIKLWAPSSTTDGTVVGTQT